MVMVPSGDEIDGEYTEGLPYVRFSVSRTWTVPQIVHTDFSFLFVTGLFYPRFIMIDSRDHSALLEIRTRLL